MTQNNTYRKIAVSEMAPHIHSFAYGENKTEKILKWLTKWIDLALSTKKICPNDFLPSKAELAYHIGVGLGTIQNVFRSLEDLGYVESKQRVGTYIKRGKTTAIQKSTSKRDFAVKTIKKYIYENNYNIGDKLISIRQLSTILNIQNTTLRVAINALVTKGFLAKQKRDFIVQKIDKTVRDIETQTLANKIAKSIKTYIASNYDTDTKLPSTKAFAKQFNVSIKTINDAIKILAKDGIVYTRRGQYGTFVSEKQNKTAIPLYKYEKTEHKIKHYIISNCKINDKLPSIKQFSTILHTSEKTVKKALDELAEDGFVMFARGRYGGTFVIDIPQTSKEAYKWLAIDIDYLSHLEN